MDYIKGLNEQQKEAVLTKDKHVRIIAGAGSGKTRVLTTRLVHLVQEMSYDPAKLCAITFTNKAANEMKERLDLMLGEYSNVHVSTIHSLCVQIIRIEHEALKLPRSFIILDSSDQNAVLKEAYDKYGYQRQDVSYGEMTGYISNNKMAHVSPKEAMELSQDFYDEKRKAKVYAFYANRLNELDALDFDDLLLEVYYLLKTNKKVRERWQHRFDVICVDEFQDVDPVQYGIVQSLVGHKNELYVVGDPDQTIYTWRGANVRFISNFHKDYSKVKTITLEKNYRSPQKILTHANELIQHNKNRPHKDLLAHEEGSAVVEYAEYDDADAEAIQIAHKIIDLRSRGEDYFDQAVFYRSNYLSRSLEKAFRREQIPYIVYGGQSFYDRMEIRDMIAYLRVISHGDDLALRRSVAKPRRGIGEKTLADYAVRAEEKSSTIYQMMLFDSENNQARKNIKKYVELIEGFKQDALEVPLDELLRKVFVESGLEQFFKDKDEDERIDSIRELFNDVRSFVQEEANADLVDYLQTISLYTDKEETKGNSVVRIMTVHAAKGLEFENVFIMGLSDGVFPNQRSLGDTGIEEERRLMYVAITRAKKRLYLSNNKGFSFVQSRRLRPSRFIREMGLEKDKEEAVLEIEKPQIQKRQVRKNRRALSAADVVVHDAFGEGIVINLNEKTMEVAFNYPHGTKTISLSFEGVKRKESKE